MVCVSQQKEGRDGPQTTGCAMPKARMPDPGVYEQEYTFWPWGSLLAKAADWVVDHAPRSAVVLDYMCGTGFLLNEIVQRRPDITTIGCDINTAYVRYGKRRYPCVHLTQGDALTYEPSRHPDVVLCTAGLHHLTRKVQPRFVRKLSKELLIGAYLILGEELVRPFQTEAQRIGASLEMHMALMSFIVDHDATVDVIQAAADMIVNDLCERGEYKTSRIGIAKLVEPFFEVVDSVQTWPAQEAEFGDWLMVCRRM